MSNQGHWVGISADTRNYFGFIYCITDVTTGRKYIGKKQFYFAKPRVRKCKSKVADRQSPKWKGCCWKESDWRTYKGSSNSLEKHMKKYPGHTYKYEIIKLCRSRGVLTYSEVQEMWARDVLGSKLPDRTYAYFNRSIGAVKFRPPEFFSDESREKTSNHPKGNQYNTGRKASLETKTKLSKVKLGSKNTVGNISRRDKTIYIFQKGTKFFTGTRYQFCISKELNNSAVGKVLNGKQKTTKGWSLKGESNE